MDNTEDCTCKDCGWEGIFGWALTDNNGEQHSCPDCDGELVADKDM